MSIGLNEFEMSPEEIDAIGVGDNETTTRRISPDGGATYKRFKCQPCQGVWVEHYSIPLRLARCPRCDSFDCFPIEGQ